MLDYMLTFFLATIIGLILSFVPSIIDIVNEKSVKGGGKTIEGQI